MTGHRDSHLRLAVVIALEALEVGDQRYAADVLLQALEDGPRAKGVRCPDCGHWAEWAGLLEKHQLVDCPRLYDEAVAA